MSQLSVEVNHIIASWWKFQVWKAYVQPCITPLECCSAFELLWLWLIIITVYFNIMYAFSPSTQTHTAQPLPIYTIGISHRKKSIMNSDEHWLPFAFLMYMWKPFISWWVWGALFCSESVYLGRRGREGSGSVEPFCRVMTWLSSVWHFLFCLCRGLKDSPAACWLFEGECSILLCSFI